MHPLVPIGALPVAQLYWANQIMGWRSIKPVQP